MTQSVFIPGVEYIHQMMQAVLFLPYLSNSNITTHHASESVIINQNILSIHYLIDSSYHDLNPLGFAYQVTASIYNQWT